jgi:hypothetical protein
MNKNFMKYVFIIFTFLLGTHTAFAQYWDIGSRPITISSVSIDGNVYLEISPMNFTGFTSNINFGDVLVSTSSSSNTLIIGNETNYYLIILSMNLVGANTDQFILSSNPTLPITIAPSQSRDITTIRFLPTSVGEKNA